MSAKLIFKNYIKAILDKFHYDLVKKKKLSLTKDFEISQFDLNSINIINDYDIGNLITTAGKKLGSTDDPYYHALTASLPIENKKQFIESFVVNIKSIVKASRNASEAIGLKNSKLLNQFPEWALVLPWENNSLANNYSNYMKKFISKRKSLKTLYTTSSLIEKDLIIYHDIAWKSHAEQFYKLYLSIKKKGFDNKNAIPVLLFKYKNNLKLSLSDDGNHRIRVAYVLGIKNVPLKISKIIDFQTLENWFNVKNGLYTTKEAEKIFIDYFNYSGSGAYV